MTAELHEAWQELANQASSVFILVREAAGATFERQPDRVKELMTYNICKQTKELVEMLLSRNSRPDGVNLDQLLPGYRSVTLDELRDRYGDDGEFSSPCRVLDRLSRNHEPNPDQRREAAHVLARLIVLLERVWSDIRPLRPNREPGPS